MADVASLRIVFTGSVEKLQKSLEDVTSSLFKLQTRTEKIGRALSTGLTLPLAAIGAGAAKLSIDFNRAMANIGTLIPDQVDRLQELKTTVQELAVATGKSTGDVAGGLYEVLSAMGDTADTAKILEINVKTASAGLATVNETVKFTTAVTKGYGDTTAVATQKVADLGAKAVEIGQTTFPELAASIGQVVPLSVALGVSQEELFAVMGTFTGVTGDASLVMTQLRSALTGLLDPSKELQALYDKLNVKSGQALIQQYGLAGALQIVARSAEVSGVPITKLLGRVEGVTLALAASGKQADAYDVALDKMKNRAVTVDKQFRQQTEGINKLGFQFDQLKSRLLVVAQQFGDALAPGLTSLGDSAGKLVTKLEALVKWFSQLSPQTRTLAVQIGAVAIATGPLLVVTSKIVAVYANLWPLLKLVSSGFSLLFSTIVTLSGGLVKAAALTLVFAGNISRLMLVAAGTALSTLAGVITGTVIPAFLAVGRTIAGLIASTGPLGLMSLAVTAAIAAWYKWDEITAIVQNVYTAVKTWMLDKLAAIWDGIKDKTAQVTGWFRDMYQAVVGGSYVPDMVTGITTEFSKLYNSMVKPTIDATTAVISQMANMQRQVAQAIATMITTAATQFAEFKKAALSALVSDGASGVLDVVQQKLSALGTTIANAVAPAFNKLGESTKKPIEGVKFTADAADKASQKLQKLKDKVAELGDKIDDLAKLNNPTASLVKKIHDLLASGKEGNELADALKKIRDEYAKNEKELKKFEKALDAANDQLTDEKKRLEDVSRRVAELAGTDRFPDLTRKIEDCFGRRSQMTAQEFASELAKIGEEFATTDEKAQAFEQTLQKIKDRQGKGFWESMIPAGFKKLDKDALLDFSTQLGDAVQNTVANALSNALRSGDVKGAIKDLAAGIGETLGTAVFGPIGGAIGGFIGDRIAKDITTIGESTKKTIKGIATAIDTIFPGVGTGLGIITSAILGGSKDADTQVREGFIKWLDDVIKKVGQIQIMSSDGSFMNLSSSMFSASGDQFTKPGWVQDWWQEMGDAAATAFSGVGEGLAQILGLAQEMGPQIAVMLSDAMGGSVDNLRLFLNAANIDTQQLEDALVAAGNSGKMSWLEVEGAIQGVNAATGQGLVAVGNVDGAIQQLIASGGRGAVAIQALQNLGIEAMEAGAKSLEDLKARMRASGKYTEEQIAQLFQAFANRGITSLDQLANASDRTGGGIIADLDAMGFGFDEVADSVDGTRDSLSELNDEADNLDGREIGITVKVHYEEDNKPDALKNADGNIFNRMGRVKAFADGGIVSTPTMFGFGRGQLGLMGESGPEAIFPLTRRGGRLGISADMPDAGALRSGDTVVVNVNIDASHSGDGVRATVEEAFRRYEPQIVGKTIETIVDRKRRGGAIGKVLSR